MRDSFFIYEEMKRIQSLALMSHKLLHALENCNVKRIIQAVAIIYNLFTHPDIVADCVRTKNDPAFVLPETQYDVRTSNVLFNTEKKGIFINLFLNGITVK